MYSFNKFYFVNLLFVAVKVSEQMMITTAASNEFPKQSFMSPTANKPAKPKVWHENNTNEYKNTAEKKAKYKIISKVMATKLAFKNLKATLFKNHDAWQPFAPKMVSNFSQQTDSTEASS